jgi:hypothetical protein
MKTPSLGPQARRIVDAARHGDDPDAAARARIHAALVRRMGVGAAVATAAVTTTTAAKASSALAGATGLGGALFGKALVALAIVSAVGTGSYAIKRARKVHAPTEHETVSVVATVARPAAPVVTVVAKAAVAIVTSAAPTATIAVATAKPVAAPTVPAPVPDDVASEVAVLREAHAALQAGDPSRALSVLDAAKKTGSLAQERAAVRVLALCALGRSDARAAADRFLSGNPSSPLASRIRTACKVE